MKRQHRVEFSAIGKGYAFGVTFFRVPNEIAIIIGKLRISFWCGNLPK